VRQPSRPKFTSYTRLLVVVAATALFGARPLLGQEPDAADQAAALAKQVQNPLATLITLPLQANLNDGVGPHDRRMTNFNVQPVIPFVGEKWNIIARAIIPLMSIPIDTLGSITGVGDMNISLFVSPAKAGKVLWGVGPAIILPTASNEAALGSGKLSIGPTGVIFFSPGHWTMGIVANNVWSVAGDATQESVNQFFAQWFLNYNFGGGWALGSAPIITCNWNAPDGEQCIIPLGLQLSKVMRFGKLPVNLLAGYYENIEHPPGGPTSQIRIQVNLLFPLH